MTDQAFARQRIDRLLKGEPIAIGGRTIQPVARASGWWGAQGGAASGAWLWLRQMPVEIVVHETDGLTVRLPIVDATRQAIRGVAAAGLTVAGICLVIMLIVSLARPRRNPQ